MTARAHVAFAQHLKFRGHTIIYQMELAEWVESLPLEYVVPLVSWHYVSVLQGYAMCM